MHFFKLALSFLAIGGVTYALLKIERASAWLVVVSFVMAFATLITALPHLPEAVEGLTKTAKKLAEILPSPQPGGEITPAPYQEHAWSHTAVQSKCAALVMSPQGAWGASFGSGLDCFARLRRAKAACAINGGDPCNRYAAGLWVVGIKCRMGSGYYSFVGDGTSKSEAFARAYERADLWGVAAGSCKPRVAVSANDPAPHRYH